MLRSSILPLLVLFFVATASATAQEPCATAGGPEHLVTGNVSDASSAAVADAVVSFRCGELVRSARTAADGSFRLPLPAGTYRVAATREGFGTIERSVAVAGSTGPLDLQLPLGMMLQVIEVTGRKPRTAFADTSFAVTKTETDLLDLPQSVSAVTKEVIEDQNLMRLNEIAPYAAGVNEFSVYDDITIRGFRNYDDRRINGLRAFNNFWSQPLIAHLERVEVVKGPASAVFGAASPGGTINMVTKKPLASGQHEVAVHAGTYGTRYGAFDSTGSLGTERLLYRLNLAFEDSGSFRDNTFNESMLLAPSLSFMPTDSTRINADVVHGRNDSVLDRGQPAVNGSSDLGQVPVSRSVTQPGDRLDTENTSLNVTLEQRLSDSWTVAATHMTYRYDEELVEHRFSNFASPSVINLRYAQRTSEADVRSNSAYITGVLQTGPVYHRILAGIDTTRREDFSRDFSANRIGTFDLLDPVYIERDPSTYPLRESTWGGNLETRGLYVQDQIIFGDWQFLLGLRHEDFETTPSGEAAQADTALVPRLGIVYSLTASQSVYASWIEGFEPPDSWVNQPYYGGPFDPMTSRLIEVGYKQRAFGDRLLFTTSLYEIERSNVVVWANDPNNVDLYRQRGQERARGYELEANGNVTDRLTLIANYAFNEAVVTEDTVPELVGRTKENAPEHSATVWGRYRLTGGLGFGAGVTHVSERETFDTALTLPSYTLVNAAAYFDFRQMQFALLGKNLTDETHWTGGYYFGRVFPGEPRTVELSVKYRF